MGFTYHIEPEKLSKTFHVLHCITYFILFLFLLAHQRNNLQLHQTVAGRVKIVPT